MDLCVMIEGQEDVGWDHWQALAAGCEANGIPALFRSDHYLSLGEGADGVDRVMLQLLLHDDLDQLALIGGELADAVR
jgi:hypothetical protein